MTTTNTVVGVSHVRARYHFKALKFWYLIGGVAVLSLVLLGQYFSNNHAETTAGKSELVQEEVSSKQALPEKQVLPSNSQDQAKGSILPHEQKAETVKQSEILLPVEPFADSENAVQEAEQIENQAKTSQNNKEQAVISRKKPYETSECAKIRNLVNDERSTGKWSEMVNKLTSSAECWQNKTERLRLLTLAYQELYKFDQCVKIGQKSKDAMVKKTVEFCAKRLAKQGKE